MIFLLGFLTAWLLALAAVPALWRRAERLSRRRLEMLMPISPREVAAERDALRAELAIELRRMESALEEGAAACAAAQADVGRERLVTADLRARLAVLEEDHAGRGIHVATLQQDLAAAVAAHDVTRATLSETEATARDRAQALVDQGRELAAVDRLAEERRASLLAAEARIAALAAHLDSATQIASAAQPSPPAALDELIAANKALHLKSNAAAHALADTRAELERLKSAGLVALDDLTDLDDPHLRRTLQDVGRVIARLAAEPPRQPAVADARAV